jgi:hypothetical protein
MSMDYIRSYYKVPAKRGARVEYLATDGELLQATITGSRGQYLRARLDNSTRSILLHPTSRLKYLPDGPCFDGIDDIGGEPSAS